MYELSKEESERILQLKMQKKDHMTWKFEQYYFFQQFQQQHPDRLSHMLILEPPLSTPESVQNSIKMAQLPPVEDATIDEDNGEGQKEKTIKVCLIDESSYKAIGLWTAQNRLCRHGLVWASLQGERRLAMKLVPYKKAWPVLE